jgi:rhodanese-related sulfurtransferase
MPSHESPSISPADLATFDGDLQLLDVREPFEAQLARIEGATLIPLGSLEQSIGSIRTDRAVVVHCHHDSRSRMAVAILKRHGIEDVRWLEGGIDAWARQIDPSVPTY